MPLVFSDFSSYPNYMFSIKTLIALLLYVTDVFFCIKAIKEKDSKAYAITKPLLMSTLLLTFIMALPVGTAWSISNRFVVLALCLHTVGDILLLVPKSKCKMCFYIGMICFFAGHVMYAANFVADRFPSSNTCGIAALIVVIIFEALFVRQLLTKARKYTPLFVPYTFGLAAMAIMISSQIPTNPRWYASVISLVGTVLFTFSDYCICRREIRIPLAGQMVVMPTYILGQTMIVGGILLSQI